MAGRTTESAAGCMGYARTVSDYRWCKVVHAHIVRTFSMYIRRLIFEDHPRSAEFSIWSSEQVELIVFCEGSVFACIQFGRYTFLLDTMPDGGKC